MCSGDLLRSLIRSLERTIPVRRIRQHDAGNLLDRDLQIRAPDSVARLHQRNGSAVRRRLQTVINVVHPFEGHRLPGIHLENNALGAIDPCLVVSNRRTRHHPAIFENRCHFDQRHIHLAQKPIFHELRHMAQMNVHVLHFAGVDSLARLRIRLVGKPQMNPARHRQRPVELRTGGSAGKDADLELLAAKMGVGNPVRQLNRHRLRIARAGKSAHANLIAGPDQSRRLLGAHDSPFELGVQNARGGRGRNTHGRSLTICKK